jgi:type IV secretory pathway VirB4 component
MDGEMIRFKGGSDISLNPFAGLSKSGLYLEESKNKGADSDIEVIQIGNYVVSKDSIIYTKSIVAAMCGVTNDTEKVALIYRAISEGIKKYGSELDITKLSLVLSGLNTKVAEELSISLYPYTTSGVHGKYFKGDGEINISFKRQLTVFEFEEIKNDSGLLSVMLQVIMMQVFLQVLCGDRKTKFMLIVDEAWMILGHSAKFLSELARTVRKYNGSLITCVQNFSDLQGTPDRRAILENSTWTLLLKQDEKGLSAFKESEAFKDMLPLIESISLAPGKYAEVLFVATGISVIGRLCLDPYAQCLFSTDAADFKYLSEAKAMGISKDEALERLAREKATTNK